MYMIAFVSVDGLSVCSTHSYNIVDSGMLICGYTGAMFTETVGSHYESSASPMFNTDVETFSV